MTFLATALPASALPALSPGVFSYAHLVALTDSMGLFEHALGEVPRSEHGYCVDDVARGLIVTVSEPNQTQELARLTELYLRFLESAIDRNGMVHNRMNVAGRWTDTPDVGDWWGRALWALGVAAVKAPLAASRKRALRAFLKMARRRSPNPRAMVFAGLGAGELLLAGSADARVLALLIDAVAVIPSQPASGWAWPEERLRYGNGSLAEVLILAGAALHDVELRARGIRLLEFLLDHEWRDGHFSVTGVDGCDATATGPQFDQQPIELVALADAAARAFDVTGDPRWLSPVRAAWGWFMGDNDMATAMVDPETGAGFDGLQLHGRNDNRGAESTLAALGTWQQARRLGQVALP